MLYYNQCPHCLAETIQQFPYVSLAAAPEVFKQVQKDIIAGFGEIVHPQLYEMYRENYHKAINSVLGNPKANEAYFDLAEKFKLNTARVAAYKSHYATSVLKDVYQTDPTRFPQKCDALLKTFNRWQATEYNTATARTRTAKQWSQFQSEADLYPNLEWLATRSSTPRELHASFVGLILPQNDKFWENNQPGNLYNCKCDWRATDKAVNKLPDLETVKPSPGLDGNPATTGEVFSDSHPYYKKASKSMKAGSYKIEYPDSEAKFPISIVADKREIADNVATARILLAQFPELKINVRPHFAAVTNPEYVINDRVCDAKRIEKYSGINNGIRKAVNKQGCTAVIIDFNKNFNTSIALSDEAINKCIGGFLDRYRDFEDGLICYVVYGSQAAILTKENLVAHKIRKLLKELMP